MDLKSLHQILSAVASGDKSVDEAVSNLVNHSYEDIEYAHIDHHRSLRK
jgi:NCAIR mutase (PurE)-related protein